MSASSYRFVCEIAKGGMGRVELVLRADGDFARLYARKRLLASLVDDEESRLMFLDEARIAGTLRHPNIVSVYDVGEDEEGLFLVMDYVEGVPVTELITWARRRNERLPIQVVLQIARQAALGLHAAHEACGLDGEPLHVVHRDVSPSNLLVDVHGVVRVADFGIARAAGRRAKTSTGLFKGKVGYLAPELLRFRPPDRRADLYALGVVLYEMLNGERLYAGREVSEVARRILEEPPPDLGEQRGDVPDALVELGFELLAKDPEYRPATALEVAERLDRIEQDLLALEEPLDLPRWAREHIDDTEIVRRRDLAEQVRRRGSEPPHRPDVAEEVAAPRRARALAAPLLLAASLAGSGLAWWLTSRGRAAPQAPSAEAPVAAPRGVDALPNPRPSPMPAVGPTPPAQTDPLDSSAAAVQDAVMASAHSEAAARATSPDGQGGSRTSSARRSLASASMRTSMRTSSMRSSMRPSAGEGPPASSMQGADALQPWGWE